MIKLNDKTISLTIFPDQTSQVWKLETIQLDINNISWDFDSESEFMHLAQLVDLIKVEAPHSYLTLTIDYLPYARQDKRISNKSSFALITFSRLLNTLNFDKVRSLDVHSDAAHYLIHNFNSNFPYTQIEKVVEKVNPEIICFPDKGAIRRYGKELAFLGKIHTYGEKVRDKLSGNITSYELKGDVKDANVLIVDDICDGGMTFILLAKQLLTNGAKSVNLYTTHGIYSKGLRPLHEAGISFIFNKHGKVDETRIGNLVYTNMENF